ncbi:HsdM family class I SAM-dependent methyltransferase [Rhizobium skierniewicense]|uniref:HsdM family class I SAM-dependent methyltransferase n=1 Tax=Rhizobium skierniewicense TaxID=984260 RepID=UPI001573FF94|nr:N-6 DNA methylase [Rhizobium skierniewicense]NTF34130.1 N-6 DNA methylase [Rhizobium skierniewicense]
MTALLDHIANILGYSGDAGFVRAAAFDRQPNHRHALRLAEQRMSVTGAFGLWTGRSGAISGPDHRRFTPLVYLAAADDEADAKEIHRRVWSQGLVPHLIIATDTRVWLCQGFAFSSTAWKQFAVELTAVSDLTSVNRRHALAPIAASSIRSSMAWRDKARAGDEFVDERLLRSLAELSIAFSKPAEGRGELEAVATNALIARLLYFYFLVDRQFVTPARLAAWKLDDITIEGDSDWSFSATQKLFGRLDEVFNGSIFPMKAAHEKGIDASHINDLRRVLRHGGRLHADGNLQFGFLDYDFASIRTETLSAIYEMFLHNEQADAGHRFGAFYTPPYLADYALDRLEDETPLIEGVRVLDPAAGSGVFLVGAYRRIVEATLPSGRSQLPLPRLHKLMTASIFGVELNDTACHVAAFSLYLTMLDYVDPADADDYAAWPVVVGRSRLFPPMLTGSDTGSANIRAGDFFSPIAEGIECDVVVGNPPWVQLPKLGSQHAVTYAHKHKDDAPIGDKQAAELFAWKLLNEHLVAGGVLSLLLPLKSLVNRFSDPFTAALRRRTEIVGIADLAHLRYVLFRRSTARSAGVGHAEKAAKSARQSTAGIILRNRKPEPEHQFWTFRPLRPTQPASRKGRLWILLHDWTQVQWHLQADMNDTNWARVFTCTAIDRRILSGLDRRIAAGRLQTLGSLFGIGLEFKIEVDQNIEREYVLGTEQSSENFWLRQLGLISDLLPTERRAVPLPQAQIDRAIPSARPFLQGNVVVMPRNCERALFIRDPVAPSFMIVGCFPEHAGSTLPSNRAIFLEAMAAFMSTDTFRYLSFVSSRRMMIDRASIELSTVTALPWPFDGLDDPRLKDMCNGSASEREQLAIDALGIPPSYRATIEEFGEFRMRFRDGGVPKDGIEDVEPDDVSRYRETLLAEVDGGKGRYEVCHREIEGSDLAAVTIRFVAGTANAVHTDEDADAAVREYRRQGASSMSHSRYLWHSRRLMQTVLIKPRDKLHWSMDRAFADADLVLAAIMSGFDNSEAA